MDENQPVRSAAGSPASEERPAAGSALALPGWEHRLRLAWGRSAATLGAMTPGQRLWGGAALAMAVAMAAGLLWYALRPDLRVLYSGLAPADAREIASGLAAAGIPFELSADGATLRVPADTLDKARLASTARGGPKSGRMGFELFDKPNWIGSEFDEKVNYQRALEGELEHTIDSMGAVESSRVHLTLPHDSLFTDQQRAAKASVVLKLKHRSLSAEEADAVRNLVASAVDGLSSDQVILADADGHAVLGRKSASAEIEAHEEALAERLVETLEPVAGTGNVRASVNIDYDTSIQDETDETYDPAAVVPLSTQKSQQSATPAPAAAGVPGTASNAPNPTPPLFPTQAANAQSSTQESDTYAASKKTRRVQQGSGKVRRITAAILVNDRMTAGGGKAPPAWKPREAEEMKRMTMLAQGVIGYDQGRGDQISVENISFDDNRGVPAPTFAERMLKGASQSEALLKYATILAAMLGLILFVIRPIAARGKPGTVPAALAAGAAGKAGAGKAAELPGAAAEAGLPPLAAGDLILEAQRKRAQSLHDGVVETIKSDPALSSRLLHSWIHADHPG
jgi:flagellar M-ring protein FliF